MSFRVAKVHPVNEDKQMERLMSIQKKQEKITSNYFQHIKRSLLGGRKYLQGTQEDRWNAKSTGKSYGKCDVEMWKAKINLHNSGIEEGIREAKNIQNSI